MLVHYCFLFLGLFIICMGLRIPKTHFVNIALNKPTMSSDMNHPHFSSDQGVDGDLKWRRINHPLNGSGVHTVTTRNPWWTVDLEGEYIIQRLKLYNRNDSRRAQNRIKGFSIFVSPSPNATDWKNSTLCYEDSETRSRAEYDITCAKPLRGSFIALRLNSLNYLNFRELEVYTCEQSWYGVNCSKDCSERHCTNPHSSCDVNGSCKGNSCSDNSVCLVCADGWFGDDCTGQCNSNCTRCIGDKGQCITCVDGHYNFNKQCTYKCGDRQCNDPTDGCQQAGKCSSGCRNGFYQEDCLSPCPVQDCVRCEQSNGVCLQCAPGLFSGYCNQTCPINCADNCCRVRDGVCFSCKLGYYGDRCDKMCRGMCAKYSGNKDARNGVGICDRNTGVCLNGCVTGYFGGSCQYECNARCGGGPNGHRTCNQSTGSCNDGCVTGYYGETCSKQCSAQCFMSDCHRRNGSCLQGCLYGLGGQSCDTRTNTDRDKGDKSISITTFTVVVCVQSLIFIIVVIIVMSYKYIREKKETHRQKVNGQFTAQEGMQSSFTYEMLDNRASSQVNLVENAVYSS